MVDARNDRYFPGDLIRTKGNDAVYRVVKQLGEGGMAEVYVATDQKIKVDVVVKMLRPDKAREQPILQTMFDDEYRILGWLRSQRCKYVPHLHFSSTTDRGESFYVMEHLRGTSVHEILARRAKGALRVYSALDVAIQLFAGLASVHGFRVIHRDIKPGNVILHLEHGEQYLKLIDFGIAKLLDEVRPNEKFVGTWVYSAPEQVLEGELTTAVDVFSAGMLTFELLAGMRPYPDPRKVEQLISRARDRAKPLRDCGEFPPKLAELIDATMELDPRNRPTAEQVADALGPIKRALPGDDDQRFVTDNGALKDPTAHQQPITRADLDNATDPDGMDAPWLAALRREHERAEILGTSRPLEVAAEEDTIASTKVGKPRAKHLQDTVQDLTAQQAAAVAALASTVPAVLDLTKVSPRAAATKSVKAAPLTAEDRARERTVELPGRPGANVAAPVVIQQAPWKPIVGGGPETNPASLPPATPMPLAEKKRANEARAAAAQVRELDGAGNNWQQALSSVTAPPSATPVPQVSSPRPPQAQVISPVPSPPTRPVAPRKLVPGKDQIPASLSNEKRRGAMPVALVAVLVVVISALVLGVVFMAASKKGLSR